MSDCKRHTISDATWEDLERLGLLGAAYALTEVSHV